MLQFHQLLSTFYSNKLFPIDTCIYYLVTSKRYFPVYSLELLKKRIELGFEDPVFKSGKRGFNYTYFSTQTRAGNVSAKHVILFIYITTGKRG